MAAWATDEASADRHVPPPHRPRIAPARSPLVALATVEPTHRTEPEQPDRHDTDGVEPEYER